MTTLIGNTCPGEFNLALLPAVGECITACVRSMQSVSVLVKRTMRSAFDSELACRSGRSGWSIGVSGNPGEASNTE